MTVTVKRLGPEDLSLLETAAPGVFDHTPQAGLTAEFLHDPRHHLIAAIDEGRIVGFVSAVHYVHPDKATEMWINEVAVAPTHQRHGVGRTMLEAMLALGRQLGCANAWVLTDHANTAAMRLYARRGGVEHPVRVAMFEFSLR